MKVGIMFFLLFSISSLAQVKSTTWVDLKRLVNTEPRVVVVYLHSENCSYCLMMEKKTFADLAVQDALNQHFYFVSMKATNADDIVFNEKLYKGSSAKQPKRDHELAQHLSQGQGYPALVFLDSQLKPIYKYNGYLKPTQFLQNLTLLHEAQEQGKID